MTWINTKVEFEWDGEKYVETNVEGYEYEGEIELVQRRIYESSRPDQRAQSDIDERRRGTAKKRQSARRDTYARKHDAQFGRMQKIIRQDSLMRENMERNLREEYGNMPFYDKLAFHGTMIPNLTGMFGTERVGDPFRENGFSGEDNYINMIMGDRPMFTTEGFRDKQVDKDDPSAWSSELESRAQDIVDQYHGTGKYSRDIGSLMNYMHSQPQSTVQGPTRDIYSSDPRQGLLYEE